MFLSREPLADPQDYFLCIYALLPKWLRYDLLYSFMTSQSFSSIKGLPEVTFYTFFFLITRSRQLNGHIYDGISSQAVQLRGVNVCVFQGQWPRIPHLLKTAEEICAYYRLCCWVKIAWAQNTWTSESCKKPLLPNLKAGFCFEHEATFLNWRMSSWIGKMQQVSSPIQNEWGPSIKFTG